MDELDTPLRNGSQRSRSYGSANSNPNSPNKPSLHRRDASWGTGQGTENTKPTKIISATLPTARSSLNDQLMASSLGRTLSSIPAANNPYSSSPQLIPYSSSPQLYRDRAQSGDFLMNPIVNKGVENPLLANTSMPSMTQLHRARSNSRGTFMYSSSSNTNTPVRHYHQQDEVDLRMAPELPILKMNHRNRGSQSSLHDVGLNLDESDNNHLDDNYSIRSRGSYNSSNNATTITDAGIEEPPETLDDILDGMVTIHSYSSSHMLSKLDQSGPASPNTKKAFTRIHNSSEYGQDISPFLGGNHASNVDLAGAHRSCMATQQSMLLRSMQSNQNIHGSTRMQFGSIPRTSNIDLASGNQSSPKEFLSQSMPISDHHPLHTNTRLLKPIQSADLWKQGRRYLIAPAALATCPLSTIKSLTGTSVDSVREAALSAEPPKASGAIELGDAFMTYVGDKYHLTCGKWSSCRLVLRQNYLFEYDLGAPLDGPPRGIAHLQHAIAYSHPDFEDAIELHFYASPCAKVDLRVLLVRVKNKEDRDHWITCLNKAARLKISDMWDYKEDKPLGTGRYASIYPAQRRTPTKSSAENDQNADTCALKIIDKSEFWRLVLKGRERCDTIVRELAVQSTLTAKFGTQPTFLQIHGFFETSEKIVIELELLDGRDLFEYISSKGVLEEDEAGLIMRDVLVALNSMSRAGIAHRDIKPANILMAKQKEEGISVKVADFGMSSLVGVDGLVRGRCGSPGYVAPEILKAVAGEGYRNQVDIFSAGVTLYLMLCGYEPFYGETEKALLNANMTAHVDFPDSEWKKVSPEAKDLVKQMLKIDPKERISARDAIEHPWIASIVNEQTDRPETNTFEDENAGVCSLM